jgi:hypothetical protein
LGRVSEKKLVELYAPHVKVPPGYRGLGDRGFHNTSRYYDNVNPVLTPAFLSGRLQFTADEVQSDHATCKLRYTCEVAYSRVTNEAALKDSIPYSRFSILHHIIHWGHANINLGQPLQK